MDAVLNNREKGRLKGTMKIIDSHAHIVQYIAGIGSGERAQHRRRNGPLCQRTGSPDDTGAVSYRRRKPEQLLEIMDENGVEKSVLLQGNFYGFQNYYTWEAVKSIRTVLSAPPAMIPIPLTGMESGAFCLKNWDLRLKSSRSAPAPA